MDIYNQEKRTEIMSRIRAKGSKLEMQFSEKLTERGISNFSLNCQNVLGRPDIVFPDKKIAIFLDSCFWHGCPKHYKAPASRQEFWDHKIQGNKRRDKEVSQELGRQGWKVFRIWEHSVKNKRCLKWWITRIINAVS
jgi:DNA mismatch endonuclease (patch repair protein)